MLTVGSHQVSILKYLTSGGYAQVYTAKVFPVDPNYETDVTCLKRVIVPNKASLNTLRAEVDAMKVLRNNKYIVSYIDSHASKFNLNDGSYEVFVLMEYCDGGGLIDYLNTRLQTRLHENEILTILIQIGQGLAAMHYMDPPIIHRDLKIENVLLTSRLEFKLCDFGSVSGVIRPPSNAQELAYVQHDVMKNTTAQYRAPEMININSGFSIDEKSDIWALGVFLYKLCFYTTPFEKTGEQGILSGFFEFPSFPQYTGRLKQLIQAMLSLNPTQRPDIYHVVKEVSHMLGKPCPIENYQRRKYSIPVSTPYSHVQRSSSSLTFPSQPVQQMVAVSEHSKPSNISNGTISWVDSRAGPQSNHMPLKKLSHSYGNNIPISNNFVMNQINARKQVPILSAKVENTYPYSSSSSSSSSIDTISSTAKTHLNDDGGSSLQNKLKDEIRRIKSNTDNLQSALRDNDIHSKLGPIVSEKSKTFGGFGGHEQQVKRKSLPIQLQYETTLTSKLGDNSERSTSSHIPDKHQHSRGSSPKMDGAMPIRKIQSDGAYITRTEDTDFCTKNKEEIKNMLKAKMKSKLAASEESFSRTQESKTIISNDDPTKLSIGENPHNTAYGNAVKIELNDAPPSPILKASKKRNPNRPQIPPKPKNLRPQAPPKPASLAAIKKTVSPIVSMTETTKNLANINISGDEKEMREQYPSPA